jgi:hypothetical protein
MSETAVIGNIIAQRLFRGRAGGCSKEPRQGFLISVLSLQTEYEHRTRSIGVSRPTN